METKDITLLGMGLAFATILISVVVLRLTRVRLIGALLLAVFRMTLQLGLVGLYLTFLFELNDPLINLGYVLLMIAVANYSVLRSTGLSLRMFAYTFPALLVAIGATLAYFIVLVYRPDPLLDARYVIPVAGMLLGHSMRRTIITLERFYTSVVQDQEGYASLLGLGATTREALLPYLGSAWRAGLSPALAAMATMGIVSLPGMMTGQILGGSGPIVAIKYQITIIVAIFVATELASLLAVLFSIRGGFDAFGFLRPSTFRRPARG